MGTESDVLRTAVAQLIFAGDPQELLNLYAGGDVALTPQEISRLYGNESLRPEEQEELIEIEAAIPEELLPHPEERTIVPAEMLELTARYAFERGKVEPAVRALQEANSLDRAYELYTSFAMDSLENGNDAQAAFELVIAGRLGWAQLSAEARVDFVANLGVDFGELAGMLGAEISRGKLSGGRALPDFPAWQTYGLLLHSRCAVEGCISDREPEAIAPLAVRYLLHDAELAERALQTSGDARRLLRALAAETDSDLPTYAERYAQALQRYRQLQEEKLIYDPRQGTEDESGVEEPADYSTTPPDESQPESARAEAARAGLYEVQSILLGWREENWRNCLSALALAHPLSVFTVCVVRSPDLGGFVIPAGETATDFLRAIT
ncbi:MAG: hypothetical protein ACUVX8_00145 [Candidatus Zipacnadales bacterium]